MTKRQKQVLTLVKEGVNTSVSLAQRLGVSRTRMSVALNYLVSTGKLTQRGVRHREGVAGRPPLRYEVAP